MFEAALAENPADLTVLEALREIYTRLGDIERLMETAERIERVDPDQGALGGGRPRAVDPTPAAPIVPAAPPRAPARPSIGPAVPPPAPARPSSAPPSIITPPSLVTAPSTPARLANAMPAARLPACEPGKAGGVSPVRKRGSRARIGELLVAEGVISQDSSTRRFASTAARRSGSAPCWRAA